MKNILFASILFLFLFLFLWPAKTTTSAFGRCWLKTAGISCPAVSCLDYRQVSYCCYEQEDCVQLQKTNPVCEGDKGIRSAIGCIPVLSGKESFLVFILKWAIGVGGGIAFLLIVYAGFMVMTSASNPERLKAGQELLTSVISGLIMLIFSVFILRVIGVDILDIPGFGP